MARRRLVTLTTDLGSAYAAQMKAVLYRSVAPGHVIDIAHDLPAHGIDEAAFLLRHIGAAFPSGTVHVAVVDPGVGGARAPIAVRCTDGSILVGPDNGVLYPLAHHLGPRSTVRIDPARANPDGVVSATFEGRDVFAPAAARLATGTRLSALGRPHTLTALLPRPPRWRDGWAVGRVVHVDRFGNAITNIPSEWFPTTPSEVRLRTGTRVRRAPRRRTYTELPRAGVGVLGSSFGTLEVSAREARAVDRLPLAVGRVLAIREGTPGQTVNIADPRYASARGVPDDRTMAKRDYYEVLGLSRSASTDEVKSAYRRLARQFHPDVNKGDTKVAEERFKEVSEAYEVLADTEKRKRYDQMGFAGVETDFGPQGFTWQNFTHVGDLQDLFGGSDFFQQLFEQGFLSGGLGGARGRVAGRGSDIEVSVRLPLAAAVHGADPTLEVPHHGACEDCKGTGARNGTALETCPECEGRGQVRRSQSRGFSQLITISDCPMCRGSGKRIKEACPTCRGTGTVRRTKRIQVTIPPGVEDGSVLRVPRQGLPSNGGGPSGDLFVQVSIESDGLIRREGTDGFADVEVPLVDALFGGEVRVATVTGEALLKIPAGTQPESQFRLRGEGFPRLRGRERGDLIVTAHIALPKSLTGRQKELLREALGGPTAPRDGKRSGLFGRRS